MAVFTPGKSGNPGGRPKGVSYRSALYDMLETAAPELIRKAIDQAMEGDKDMMKICFDRILPKHARAAVGEIVAALGAANKLAAIESTVNNGDLSVEEGTSYAKIVELTSKLADLDRLSSDVADLKKLLLEMKSR